MFEGTLGQFCEVLAQIEDEKHDASCQVNGVVLLRQNNLSPPRVMGHAAKCPGLLFCSTYPSQLI